VVYFHFHPSLLPLSIDLVLDLALIEKRHPSGLYRNPAAVCDVISKVTSAVVLPWQTALGGQLQCGMAAVLTVTAATSVLWLCDSYNAVYISKPCRD